MPLKSNIGKVPPELGDGWPLFFVGLSLSAQTLEHYPNVFDSPDSDVDGHSRIPQDDRCREENPDAVPKHCLLLSFSRFFVSA